MIKTLILIPEKEKLSFTKSLSQLWILAQTNHITDLITIATHCKPEIVLIHTAYQKQLTPKVLEKIKHVSVLIIFDNLHRYKLIKQKEKETLYVKITKKDLLKKINTCCKKENIAYTKPSNRIILALQEGYQVILLKDLIYCKSDKGYTTFYMLNQKKHISAKSLKEVEKKLPEMAFIRTHQSYMVNIQYIDKYDKNGYIHLYTGDIIPVSTRKKKAFIAKLLEENVIP